jgi:protein SCO1
MDYWELKIVSMSRIVYLLLSSILLFSCSSKSEDSFELPYYNDPDFTPIFLSNESDVNKRITHRIQDFSFLNQDSLITTQQNIEGKVHVANFIFTKCGVVCPMLTKNLKIVSDSLGSEKDLMFLSFSVTPWIDSPSVLQSYIERNNIENKNWHFLTGSKSEIYNLARKSYFAEEDIGFAKDSTQFLHTEHFILVDKQKRIRGVYNGTLSFEMQQLIEDIKSLKREVK